MGQVQVGDVRGKEESTEQTESLKFFPVFFPFVQYFPFIPYSLFASLIHQLDAILNKL
jgi:hypothetical protein